MFDLQPTLSDARVRLQPLREEDFDPLYAVANDPLLWEQHPSPTRYRREVFATYFEGALQSKGALLIRDAQDESVIGSSRFYDLDEANKQVTIGYTFVARRCWGKGHNQAVKALMLGHAFQFVERALFHVGAQNKRSRIAMERLGGVLIGEKSVAYFGEKANPNVVYAIEREAWFKRA
jgi:RimJ/RimL family protein N-acetyltransferase